MSMHQIHFASIDSTNTYAKQHYGTFAPDEITCITADQQTAGRGRYQRKWVSPPGGNIYATFYFRLPAQTRHLGSLAQIIAYSYASLLLREGFQPKIKWPNDILLNGKKCSGVLCETVFQKEMVDIFLGIGINVNLDAATAAQIDQPATSLAIETGKRWDQKEILKKLQKQFALDLETFKREGFTPFHDGFENLMAFKGETVRVFDGQKEWVGICHSLSHEGQLNLYLPDQTIHVVLAGDIVG